MTSKISGSRTKKVRRYRKTDRKLIPKKSHVKSENTNTDAFCISSPTELMRKNKTPNRFDYYFAFTY